MVVRDDRKSTKTLSLRLPADVYGELVAAARSDERSLNREIVALLREVLMTR